MRPSYAANASLSWPPQLLYTLARSRSSAAASTEEPGVASAAAAAGGGEVGAAEVEVGEALAGEAGVEVGVAALTGGAALLEELASDEDGVFADAESGGAAAARVALSAVR